MRLEKAEEAVPVALYIRSMTGDPAHTLENQLRALQNHAARNGMQQVRVYFDTRDDRPHLRSARAVRRRASGVLPLEKWRESQRRGNPNAPFE